MENLEAPGAVAEESLAATALLGARGLLGVCSDALSHQPSTTTSFEDDDEAERISASAHGLPDNRALLHA